MLDSNRIENNITVSSEKSYTPFQHLQDILNQYLEERPNISLNGLAKRCKVSEPTLRRIKKGQLKNLPSVTTVYELLSYLGKEKNPTKLIETFKGPIADFLTDKLPQLEVFGNMQVSLELTEVLKDPVKYLIYKLAANDSGVEHQTVLSLFGTYGENQLHSLLQDELLDQRGSRYFGKIETFALANEVFIDHFKATADFIKVDKVTNANKAYSPHFANCSTGVDKKGYSEILRIQRAALKKIRNVMADPNKSGEIPVFYLAAIDTLDKKCADEF